MKTTWETWTWAVGTEKESPLQMASNRRRGGALLANASNRRQGAFIFWERERALPAPGEDLFTVCAALKTLKIDKEKIGAPTGPAARTSGL
jgi:hypothetical protein